MQLVVLGLSSCEKCKNATAILAREKIPFSYIKLDDYLPNERDEVVRYKRFLTEKKITAVPILLLDTKETLEVTDIKTVLTRRTE